MSAAPAEVAVATTAVVVKGQCPPETASKLTRQIQVLLGEASRSLETASDLIREAYDRRAWAALDYPSWDDYCAAQFGTALVRLGRAVRQRLVAKLTSGGMSNRSIASALGISEITVRRDLSSGATDVAPEPEPEAIKVEVSNEEVSAEAQVTVEERVAVEAEMPKALVEAGMPIDAEVIQVEVIQSQLIDGDVLAGAGSGGERCQEVLPSKSVRRVRGVDGKTYTVQPAVNRRHRPLPDEFSYAVRDLVKDAQRLVRLTEDGRFLSQAADLGGREDIQRAADGIHMVLDALAEAGNR